MKRKAISVIVGFMVFSIIVFIVWSIINLICEPYLVDIAGLMTEQEEINRCVIIFLSNAGKGISFIIGIIAGEIAGKKFLTK